MANHLSTNPPRDSTSPPASSLRSGPPATPDVDHKAAKRARRKYRWKIVLGLVWPYALQALDATIIASALPWVARDFNKISQQNWIVSAFNLTSAAFIPFWAQMADVFGRYAAIIAAVFLMLIGSALCTGAPTSAYGLLLLGRGFQGVASAGLNVVVRTILADRVTLQENAKNWAIFTLVGGISYALGPVIGGYLTRANWRWCFGINLPVGAAALLAIFTILRKELLGPQPIPELDETADTGHFTKIAARLKTVDVGGQAFFLMGFGLIILALTWGGVTYPWNSAAVISSLLIGGFLFLSKRISRQRPMIPWALLTNRDIGLIFYIECATGMAMFAVLYFCNVYFIAVKGNSPDEAGLQLLFFAPGMGVGVYLCAFMCNRWPRMTFPPLFLGTITEAIGIGVLTWALFKEQSPPIFGAMAMVGAGMGLRFMVAPLHCIGIFKAHRASVIGLIAIAVPLGGTIGLTIMSTIFNNVSELDAKDGDFSRLRDQPAGVGEQAIYKAKMGVVWAFVSITPLMVLSWILCFFLGNVKLADGGGNGQDAVYAKPYLWCLWQDRQAAKSIEDPRLGSSHSRIELNSTRSKAARFECANPPSRRD
ncbi:major facilitator superfamily domain-containing protein [Hirsutella rhossiliensis]|uniref:Major facilitator superfamily domain-containing protein n=1 Tax=Hirsutella rhossiliensis TaxID=111463 RepID=A0A9P8MRN8_9HYPO|nr:major facilitator superfamily domain-containing protein [Hirsutella rhossiliensis]KAH0958961.1 major facilitator superfamily domain-containing protein [Hirsutella rhossiliensis]